MDAAIKNYRKSEVFSERNISANDEDKILSNHSVNETYVHPEMNEYKPFVKVVKSSRGSKIYDRIE